MRIRDISLTIGLCTSLLVHGAMVGGMLYGSGRGVYLNGARSTAQDERPAMDVAFGDSQGRGEALNSFDGKELFQYLDDHGNVCDIGSSDVNDYLREIAGQEFTAKDFRTWAGTVLAAQALQDLSEYHTQKQAKQNVVQAVEAVARKLGNTKAVCRKCYIHPAIIESYLDRSLAQHLSRKAAAIARASGKLSADETSVLRLLQRRLTRQAA